jgi:hypothetical protein
MQVSATKPNQKERCKVAWNLKRFEVRVRHNGVKVAGANAKPGRKYVTDAHSRMEAEMKFRQRFPEAVVRAYAQ